MEKQPQTSTETRDFHIGDILSITTGFLVSPRRMDGVYDILDYMTGEDLFTHQLPRAAETCRPSLREQHPDLAAVETPEHFDGPEHADRWLGALVLEYGETRPVAPLAHGEYQARNPIQELVEMTDGEVIVLQQQPLPDTTV